MHFPLRYLPFCECSMNEPLPTPSAALQGLGREMPALKKAHMSGCKEKTNALKHHESLGYQQFFGKAQILKHQPFQ